MCFVWGEVERRFIPWGLNSELKLVRKGPFAAVDAPSSRLLVQVAALKQEVTERLIALEAGRQGGEIAAIMQNVTALQMTAFEVTERLIALESGGPVGGQSGEMPSPMHNFTALQMTAFKQEVTERLIALESGGQGGEMPSPMHNFTALQMTAFKQEVTERLIALEAGGRVGGQSGEMSAPMQNFTALQMTAFKQEVTERLIALERLIAHERLIALNESGQGAVLDALTSLAFKWRAASFSGGCSSTCGTGTRRRTVECVLDGGVTNNVFCDVRSRPAELETCNDYSMCTYYWLPLPWGACSNTCGPGTRQRIVHCVRTDAAKTLVNSNLW
jgi:hypothetical protein